MDLFDIVGPAMIGPSSSHTAGAARIGRIARMILGEKPVRAVITFHGSFAKTYQGHGTDRAIVGGLMGMEVDDPALRNSLTLARQSGLSYEIKTAVLRGAHPNTAVLELWGETGRHVTVRGASVGGGNIEIQQLNGLDVSFTGSSNTLILQHKDTRGLIASVTGLLASESVNIATMTDFRSYPGGSAIMVIEIDSVPDRSLKEKLQAIRDVQAVALLKKR